MNNLPTPANHIGIVGIAQFNGMFQTRPPNTHHRELACHRAGEFHLMEKIIADMRNGGRARCFGIGGETEGAVPLVAGVADIGEEAAVWTWPPLISSSVIAVVCSKICSGAGKIKLLRIPSRLGYCGRQKLLADRQRKTAS
jgi:hypothetical protein